MRRLMFLLTATALLGSAVGCSCIMGKCDCDCTAPCGTAGSCCSGCGCGGCGHWFGDHVTTGDHVAAVPVDHANGPYAAVQNPGVPVFQNEHMTIQPSVVEKLPAPQPHPQLLDAAPRTPSAPVIEDATEPIVK